MTVLIAPDKFKSSCTAREVCNAISQALEEMMPGIRCIRMPLADGGEGTCALLTEASGGSLVPYTARDPLFRSFQTHYGVSADGKTAFIEMAAASGLSLLKPNEYNPLITSSVGTGDLMGAALGQGGVTSLVMGVGGTATNDGGIGMASALGARFYDSNNALLTPVGENLQHIHRIDLSEVDAAVAAAQCTLLCDVDNPLYGANGAARVFAPQKGATPPMVEILDNGLRNLHNVVQRQFHRSVNFAGAGAAGGFPAMLTLLIPTEIHSGTAFISQFVNLEDHVRQADLIISGEGRIDGQTLSGKLVNGVAALATRHNKPLVIIAGDSTLTAEQVSALGIQKLITLVNNETTPEMAMTNPLPILKQRVAEALSPYLTPNPATTPPQ